MMIYDLSLMIMMILSTRKLNALISMLTCLCTEPHIEILLHIFPMFCSTALFIVNNETDPFVILYVFEL